MLYKIYPPLTYVKTEVKKVKLLQTKRRKTIRWYLVEGGGIQHFQIKPWIIERLDRKLADGIGSNTVEKCDVTLSRAIQPLTFDVFRVLCFLAYFTEGGKGVIAWYVITVFNFRERWKYEIKTRELWLVCLSWYLNFKIFHPIFVIFNKFFSWK